MSHATRKQRRLQPYAWLGASAVTLGMGAAMVGGAAVAVADTGTDSGSAPAASSDTATHSTQASNRRAPRAARSAAAVAGGAAGNGAGETRQSRAASAAVPGSAATDVPASEVAAPAAVTAPATDLPAAAAVAPRTRAARHAAVVAPTAVAPAAVASVTAPEAAVTQTAPSPAPAADVVVNPDPPFIPNDIVPGAHVTLSLNEISASQASLTQATWGSGNVLAGIAAIVPQLFLAEAQLSLTLWQNNMPGAQQLVANTVGVPIIHQLTEINLFVTATLPSFAQCGFGGAALFMPIVSLLGAATAPTEQLISQARSDGTVYAVTLVQIKSGVEPVIRASIGGGPSTSLLVDTGSSGLMTTLDQVGTATPTDQVGVIIYSGASDTPFTYRVYKTSVDFGGGAVASDTYINVIEDTPEQEAAFKEFIASTGSNGILGTGAAAVGPGQGVVDPSADPVVNNYLPTTALPGELSDGNLLNENVFLGLFGIMVFGPNPFPARVTVPGSPYGQLQVQIGSNTPQPVTDAIIDSGGVYGTMPVSLFPGSQPGDIVPAGTKISVYTQDGQTLLYSYTTTADNGPYIVADDPLGMDVNTGFIPFSQQLIYTDYSADFPNGATVFNYT